MTDIDKAAVYRKAAEIIVRDGKTEKTLVEGRGRVGPDEELRELLKTNAPVCALGACGRAQYELYGILPKNDDAVFVNYCFTVDWDLGHGVSDYSIFSVNDRGNTTAEDIALLLKQRAEEVGGGG
ncbi:DUF6197 family protein [Streptomyces sp. S1]|uniref:DUF6197 family protein n=1 Tax=Streptomyces sp. S1 TaxID=718288 RepID=UPI003D719F56